jgi:hypothetical protein
MESARLARRAARLLPLMGLALALPGTVIAQWAWHDSAGNTTYSDAPPPPDVAPTSIIRQPTDREVRATSDTRGSAGDTGQAAGNAQPRAAAPPAPVAKTLAEQDADFRKRRLEIQKAEQKQIEEDARDKQRASACSEAQGYLRLYDDGTRMFRPDADGNRVYMDDDQRATERQKLQDQVAKNC